MTAPVEHRSHEAKAQRGQYGDRDLWRAVCPSGCRLKRADSKQAAERIALLHELSMLADAITCPCWYPEVGEFDPELYPCAVDRLKERLKQVAA